jgi:hypothetical protein
MKHIHSRFVHVFEGPSSCWTGIGIAGMAGCRRKKKKGRKKFQYLSGKKKRIQKERRRSLTGK